MAEQGDFVRGLENLARARLLAPDSIEIRYHWASVSARAGNFDDARKELKALIKNSQESIFATEIKLLLEKLEQAGVYMDGPVNSSSELP